MASKRRTKAKRIFAAAKRGQRASVALPEVLWDRGADGPANRERLRLEPATEIDPETGKETQNPNGVMRERRESWLVIYARKGHLDKRQFAAAEKLRMAADGLRDKDPLAAIAIDRVRGQSDPLAAQIDARRFFRELWAQVPSLSKPVVERVVIEDLPIKSGNPAQRERYMQRLREGIDAIA